MAGVVLETLSWKKLIILGLLLLFLLISFFLIGGLIAPNPSNVINVLGTICKNEGGIGNKEWFIPRGGHEKCIQYDNLDVPGIEDDRTSANQRQLKLVTDNQALQDDLNQSVFCVENLKPQEFPFYTGFQSQDVFNVVLGLLNPGENGENISVVQEKENVILNFYLTEEDATIQLDARIGYRNKDDDVNDWKELAKSLEERNLNCKMEGKKENGYAYDCDPLSFFELGSVHHDYYLVNIKVPVEPYKGINMGIGKLRDITLVAIHQNGGFTKVWLSIKTVMFPMVLAVLIWYWRRISLLTRPANLLERTLFALGVAMSVLNCPLEWFTLVLDMPFMLLITDIRQGGFYAMLLSFWIIFTGEHIMDQTERNRLALYWKHLLAVVIGCFCLLLFELSERGVQLANPFFSIWVTGIGSKLALSVIIIAAIAASCYFFFLCYMIFLVFRNISSKKTALPSMSSGRRLYYMGLIYRFKFLMLTTLVCAALTVIFFIMSQLSEGKWKWGDEDLNLEYTSAFFTGVYGMWNVYVIGLLSLYAPSHKQLAPEGTTSDNSQEEEVQLTYMPSTSEGSTFQSFAAKAATD
ncbi:protein wntless homolog [Ruditapes philippinarum]|uniref:protein wntless homolog n=1 Tax=Ruditapes philippinarum TaxID=129788 RepID=UPI00295B5419|nr:protein wntless homolog [Ruditapes philippinarum]